ncbi:hypothetical protein Prudu_004632 [Prunus dulcis]|uniref:Uncharacterized protein n=1 Tax=Prunus dulcis TaxID=3755 RepID=A0A4Y1QVS6_PRUDU|nr:hypothetical protein Prudu_004632 [Prunus dulcis]
MDLNSFTEKPICWNFGNVRPSWAGVEDGRDFENGVLNSKRRVSSNGFRSLVVRAMGKKNNNGNSSNSSSSSGTTLGDVLVQAVKLLSACAVSCMPEKKSQLLGRVLHATQLFIATE